MGETIDQGIVDDEATNQEPGETSTPSAPAVVNPPVTPDKYRPYKLGQ